MDYVDAYEDRYGFVPHWSMYTINPLWIGNCNLPSQMHNRLEMCKNIVNQYIGDYTTKIQNIWIDMKENR